MAVSLASLVRRARCLHFAVCRSQILVICGGADSCPQISYNLWRAQFGSPPRFCPFVSTVQRYRLLPLTLFEWADHSKIFFPFVRLQSADRHLQISSMLLWLRLFFHNLLPASSTLRRRLPAPKPNLSGAFHKNASTPLSTRSRLAGRSFVGSLGCLDESSVPASFLQRTFTHTKGPSPHRRGRRHRTRLTRSHTRTAQTDKNNVGVKELQSHPGGYNI